nr:hypothetical protein [Tanacetum cinerariifolium]
MANTRRLLTLGWHLEEIHVTWAHLEKKRTRLRICTKIHQEVLFSERRDSVTGIKQRRCDLSGDGVWIMVRASQRSRLKVNLEPSTWRRHQKHQATPSQPGAFTRRCTGSHYPKSYWESLPEDVLRVITQRRTGSHYPKTYWESLPEDILRVITRRHTGNHYPKTYWESLPEDVLEVITRRRTGSHYPKKY